MPLPKTKSNSSDVSISKALTDSYISHDKFVLVNDMLKEYDDIKKDIKNLKTSSVNQNFYYTYKTM